MKKLLAGAATIALLSACATTEPETPQADTPVDTAAETSRDKHVVETTSPDFSSMIETTGSAWPLISSSGSQAAALRA